jgi:hypothetical protein
MRTHLSTSFAGGLVGLVVVLSAFTPAVARAQALDQPSMTAPAPHSARRVAWPAIQPTPTPVDESSAAPESARPHVRFANVRFLTHAPMPASARVDLRLAFEPPLGRAALARAAQSQTDSTPREGPGRRQKMGATIGAIAGFFAGGFLGAAHDSGCRCDSPNMLGFFIGAPIGAIIGGVLGFNVF